MNKKHVCDYAEKKDVANECQGHCSMGKSVSVLCTEAFTFFIRL